jgi:hypothetical protein
MVPVPTEVSTVRLGAPSLSIGGAAAGTMTDVRSMALGDVSDCACRVSAK